jgi:hypothetical protein
VRKNRYREHRIFSRLFIPTFILSIFNMRSSSRTDIGNASTVKVLRRAVIGFGIVYLVFFLLFGAGIFAGAVVSIFKDRTSSLIDNAKNFQFWRAGSLADVVSDSEGAKGFASEGEASDVTESSVVPTTPTQGVGFLVSTIILAGAALLGLAVPVCTFSHGILACKLYKYVSVISFFLQGEL